jgi:hypothetical protein
VKAAALVLLALLVTVHMRVPLLGGPAPVPVVLLVILGGTAACLGYAIAVVLWRDGLRPVWGWVT